MNYETPEQMRKALTAVVDDPALVNATVKQYFENKRTAPKFVAPRKRTKPIASTAVLTGPTISKTEYENDMERGSNKLGRAISEMLAGYDPKTSDRLIWRGYSPHNAHKELTGTNAQVRRKALAIQADTKRHIEAQKVDGDVGCFRCGAKGCSYNKCVVIDEPTVKLPIERINRQWDKEAGYAP